MPHHQTDIIPRRNSASSNGESSRPARESTPGSPAWWDAMDILLQQPLEVQRTHTPPAPPQSPRTRPSHGAPRTDTPRLYRASPLGSISPEHPLLPADWWHSMRNIRTGINGSGDLWAGPNVLFYPDHGSIPVGVSMEQACMRTGVKYAGTLLGTLLPPQMFAVPAPMLSIRWPGYQCLDEHGIRPLEFTRLLTLHPTIPLVELAKQVADCFFEFATDEQYAQVARCPPTHPDLILLGTGPGAVNFNRLRMVKLWTTDGGRHWKLEVAIVDDYVQHF